MTNPKFLKINAWLMILIFRPTSAEKIRNSSVRLNTTVTTLKIFPVFNLQNNVNVTSSDERKLELSVGYILLLHFSATCRSVILTGTCLLRPLLLIVCFLSSMRVLIFSKSIAKLLSLQNAPKLWLLRSASTKKKKKTIQQKF